MTFTLHTASFPSDVAMSKNCCKLGVPVRLALSSHSKHLKEYEARNNLLCLFTGGVELLRNVTKSAMGVSSLRPT